MNKPFYSKRRLKKMGICLENKDNEIILSITSTGATAKQSVNIVKLIKKTQKPIKVNNESLIASAASFICQDIDRITRKIFGYE